MREVFSRVDEMADAHRDLFRTDPASGVPVLNAAAHEEAEQLAAQVFEDLASLRARFRRLAGNFHGEAPSIAPTDDSRSRSATQDDHRCIDDDALSIRTGEDEEEAGRTDEGSSAINDDASVAGVKRFAPDEDESVSVSDSANATTPEKTRVDSCDSLSRRLSLSLESDDASSEASPPSRAYTFAESVGSSEMSPPRNSSLDLDGDSPIHAVTMTSGRSDRRRDEDDGGSSIFKGTSCCNAVLL